jgi:environmental stress-induced protein Ves
MANREARNAILIEAKSGRISQIPIDPTETILQGDMMKWDAAQHRVTKMAAAADGALFVGVADHTNPQMSAGTLTADYTVAYTNIVQSALVRMIAGFAETLYGYDTVEFVTDAQHTKKTATGANVIGVVDPGWASVAGKTVAIGDEVKIWLKVPNTYVGFGGR